MRQYISETELNNIISSTSLKELCDLNILIAQKDEDKMLYVLSNIDALYNYSVQKHKSSYISHALELYKLCFWFDPCF